MSRVSHPGEVTPRTRSVANADVATGAPPSSKLDAGRRALVALESVVSVCGIGGGTYLASHPRSAMPLKYLEGTWFDSWRWPGVALFFFVGVCPILAVLATLQRRRVATTAHLLVGVGLVAWIVVEALWMVVSPPLQITFASIGVVIVVLGVAQARRTRA